MADDADRASEYEELFLVISLSNSQQNKSKLAYRGACHNCHEVVANTHQFCDADCRDDWEKRNRK